MLVNVINLIRNIKNPIIKNDHRNIFYKGIIFESEKSSHLAKRVLSGVVIGLRRKHRGATL